MAGGLTEERDGCRLTVDGTIFPERLEPPSLDRRSPDIRRRRVERPGTAVPPLGLRRLRRREPRSLRFDRSHVSRAGAAAPGGSACAPDQPSAPPGSRDVGAIEASAKIVLGKNPRLRESLAIASAAARPPRPEVTPRPGEVLIRIRSTNVQPPTRREDIPRDAFEAIPLRRFAYPQFSPRPR